MVRSLLPEPLATLPFRVLLPLALLTCFGATVLYSAAGGTFWTYSFSHLVRFGVFVVMALVLRRFRATSSCSPLTPAYFAVLLLLFVVEAIGVIGGGSQRWIDLGFMQLQPSEFMKPWHRAGAGELLPLTAGRADQHLARAGSGGRADRDADGSWCCCSPDLGTALAIGFGGGRSCCFLAGNPGQMVLRAARWPPRLPRRWPISSSCTITSAPG
jgi:rod shape determining protein RodA